MNTYAIFTHPILGTEVIKDGDSWPAFFFTWIWAFTKKLWTQGIALLFAVLVANSIGFAIAAEGGILTVIGLVVTVIPMFIAGKLGNEWRRDFAHKSGFNYEGSVKAASPEGALAVIAKTQPMQDERKDTGFIQSKQYSSPSPDTRKCPYCAEFVKAEAIICRFCHKELQPIKEPEPPADSANPKKNESPKLDAELLTEEQIQLMNKFGISFDRNKFHYDKYQYDRLSDAVAYAKIQKRQK